MNTRMPCKTKIYFDVTGSIYVLGAHNLNAAIRSNPPDVEFFLITETAWLFIKVDLLQENNYVCIRLQN